jgi:hypothetical protein
MRIVYTSFVRWLTVPQSAPEMNPVNFRNVQIDAVGVGLASTASPFLQVFIRLMGASTLQVSMLTTMPAVTGLLLALPLGRFLQTRKNIVPWFSAARLAVLSCYALTGLIAFILPEKLTILGVLGIWALATVPQTVLSIAFSVVMNSVAGPAGRYELMTHRWSILGFTNAITALLAGQFLEGLPFLKIPFPLNYQLMFITLSVGGIISYYFSSRIILPDNPPIFEQAKHSIRERVKSYLDMITSEKPFVSFVSKRFVFLTGTSMVAPLFQIYYLSLGATEFWIALINIAANITVIMGYFFWMGQTRRRGSRMVLLSTTLGVSLYPILVGLTTNVWPMAFYAAMAGIFNAGLNLVLFDELMKRVPFDYSATFVAAAQGLQYLSAIFAPLLATWISDTFGFNAALIVGGLVSLVGFGLFLQEALRKPELVKDGIPPGAKSQSK